LSPGSVADLARLKVAHPLWEIIRAGVNLREFEARRGGLVIKAATPADLEDRIRRAENHWPG
jgi:hypothetical protein